jgi:mannose-6-phosphate isomerase-like protein (cupin superfamily)
MAAEKVNLAEKLATFADTWSPKVVGTLDDYEIKVVKIHGDFVWHSHAEEDELFLVLDGGFRMDFRDRSVELTAGEFLVVPKGVEHKPFAAQPCSILLFERAGVVNTGDAAPGARTVKDLERI